MEKEKTGGILKTKTMGEIREMMHNMSLEERRETQKEVVEEMNKHKAYPHVPRDLAIRIMENFPAKSLAKLMVVDKYWRDTTLSQRFEKDYLSLSEKRPKILFVSTFTANSKSKSETETKTETFHMFRSVLKKPDVSKALTEEQSVHATLKSDLAYEFTPPARDLLCFYHETKSLICNPSMGRIIPLPDVPHDSIFFLGFNPVAEEFKVLSMDKDAESSIVRVLTLRPGDTNNWRTLDTGITHHKLFAESLYLEGTIYYGAMMDFLTNVIVCFDLQTEVFRFILLPDGLHDNWCFPGTLVSFHKKLAIADVSAKSFTLWHWEDEKWCKHQFQIPKTITGPNEWSSQHRFIGTSDTSELIFAPYCSQYFSRFTEQYVIYYNYVHGTSTDVRIEGDFADFNGNIEPFLDYIESTALISTGRPM